MSNNSNKIRYFVALVVTLFALFHASSAHATSEEDKTLSPYFLVKGGAKKVEKFPLKSTATVVDIAGVIADVRITQVYKNEGKEAIEAIYVFPGSTRAAVYGMKMTIGERVRIAKIKEKKAAKRQYEAAKKAGKSASLLEQHRPNVFQMSIANIMPGDDIQVELSYTELLIPTDGTYEFSYPTVVGPRYSNLKKKDAPPSEKWVANPYTSEGASPSYSFDIHLRLDTGVPIQEVASSSHKVEVSYEGLSQAVVALAPEEKYGGNRDYILRYRLKGSQIESGMLFYEGEREKFFLMMMQPPKRIVTEELPPREYIYIVDVSGSMNGFPLQISKRLIKDLIGSLRPIDRFNVLLFAAGSSLLSDYSLPATQENIERAIRLIDGQRGGGGTELLPALERAIRLPQDDRYSRTIVVATDGYVRVETETFELVRNNLNNANVFAFGIGSSVNRYLIEGLARSGYGEPFVITKPDEAQYVADKFRRYIEHPVLTNIEIDYGDFNVYDVEPRSVPDVLAERPVVVFGKWHGPLQGSVTIKGYRGKKEYQKSFSLKEFEARKENSALRYLWARQRIATLGDYNKLNFHEERVKEITNLGLTYNLLTKYTSFIAVDDVIRNKGGAQKSVKQPLPLPKGISKHAVGGTVPTVPEPSEYLLLCVVLGMFAFFVWRRRESDAN